MVLGQSMVLSLGIESSVLHALAFLAMWDDCGEMDYSAFIASWGLISAQQALVLGLSCAF